MYVWAVQTSGIALNLEIIKVGEHILKPQTKAKKNIFHSFISLMRYNSHEGIPFKEIILKTSAQTFED